MKVSIVLGPFLPVAGGPSGAIEKRWFGVAKVLVDRGHRVTITARSWPAQRSEETVDGVRIVRRGGFARSNSLASDLAKDLLYAARVLAVLPSAEITVTNSFWLPLLCRLRRRSLGRIVVNVARFPKHQMWLYCGVDRLSAVSHAVAVEIARQSPQLAPLVRTIPNPVDTEQFRMFRADHPSNGGHRVLYTGRVHPEKGLHLLIEAIAALRADFPDIQLSIVGPTRLEHGGGGDSYLDQLKQRSAGVPVNLEPPIDDAERLAARMADADYYCYPSLAERGESFGVAPLEAMALGYAPILSHLECFQEFAEDGKNCFVFDHRHGDTVSNLGAALKRAMLSPAKAKTMGQNAAIVADGFSYERIATKYLDDWCVLVGSVSLKAENK